MKDKLSFDTPASQHKWVKQELEPDDPIYWITRRHICSECGCRRTKGLRGVLGYALGKTISRKYIPCVPVKSM